MSWGGNLLRRIRGLASRKPTNFSWVDDMVAGSGRPSSLRQLRWMKNQGIRAVLSVAEEPIPETWIRSIGIRYKHVSWPNHSPPNEDGLEKCLRFVQDLIGSGIKVAIHCGAGSGRTGTVLAAYLIKIKGLSVENAIREVRGKRPGSIERKQEEFLRKYFGAEKDDSYEARIS